MMSDRPEQHNSNSNLPIPVILMEELNKWVCACSNISYTQQWETCRIFLARVSATRLLLSGEELREFFRKLIEAIITSTEVLSSSFFAQYFLELCSTPCNLHNAGSNSIDSHNSCELDDREAMQLSKSVSIVCNWYKLLENLHYSCGYSDIEPICMSRSMYDNLLAKSIVLVMIQPQMQFQSKEQCSSSSDRSHADSTDSTRPTSLSLVHRRARFQVVMDSLSRDVRTAVYTLLFTNNAQVAALNDRGESDGLNSFLLSMGKQWIGYKHLDGLELSPVGKNYPDKMDHNYDVEIWVSALKWLSHDPCVLEARKLLAGLRCDRYDATVNNSSDGIASNNSSITFQNQPLEAGLLTASVIPKISALFTRCFSDCDDVDISESIEALLICSSTSSTVSCNHLTRRTATTQIPRAQLETVIKSSMGYNCYSPDLAQFLIDRCLPVRFIMPVTDAVLAHWGSQQLLSSGHFAPLASCTALLLALLKRLTVDDLAAVPRYNSSDSNHADAFKGSLIRGIPLSILFSQAVSCYLDLSDKAVRILGLRVATAFSSILGHTLSFEELNSPGPLLPAAPAAAVTAVSHATTKTKDKQVKEPSSTAAFRKQLGIIEMSDSSDSNSSDSDSLDSDTDTDSDDELETVGSAVDAVPPKVKPFITTYLRICLEMLQCHEPTPETHYKHHAALLSVPAIVAKNPIDIQDMCVPVLIELIQLGNEFAIDRFGELKNNAVHSLLFCYPQLALPAVTHQIESGALTLGGKVELLSSLSRAAYALAGLTHLYDIDYIQQSINPISSASTSTSTCVDGGSVASSTIEAKNSSTTIVKRPRKLALLSETGSDGGAGKRVVVFRNAFVSLLDLFLVPVMSILYAAEQEAGVVLQAQRAEEKRAQVARARMQAQTQPLLAVQSSSRVTKLPAARSGRGLIQVIATEEECEYEEIEDEELEAEAGAPTPRQPAPTAVIPTVTTTATATASATAPVSSSFLGADMDVSAPIVAVVQDFEYNSHDSGHYANGHSRRGADGRQFQVHSVHLQEGLNTMLPAHCLVALSSFVHCSVNSTRQRALIQQTLLLCDRYKNAQALALRRACLVAMHTAVESWKYVKLYSHRYRGRTHDSVSGDTTGTSAALRELCDVMHMRELYEYEHQHDRYQMPTGEDDLAVYAVVDWCARSLIPMTSSSAEMEVDMQCRVMKAGLMHMVQDII